MTVRIFQRFGVLLIGGGFGFGFQNLTTDHVTSQKSANQIPARQSHHSSPLLPTDGERAYTAFWSLSCSACSLLRGSALGSALGLATTTVCWWMGAAGLTP
jgi:hypothetical protein